MQAINADRSDEEAKQYQAVDLCCATPKDTDSMDTYLGEAGPDCHEIYSVRENAG